MSRSIAARLPRLHTICPAPGCRSPAHARGFFSKAFWGTWSTRAAADAGADIPAITGPHRLSKQQLRDQQDLDNARSASNTTSTTDNPDLAIGHADAAPARHVAVDIDGHSRVLDTAFLRDSCACLQCRDPHSKQKLFQTSDIPSDLTGSYKHVVDADKGPMIELQWASDVPGYGPDHRTRHSIDWLRRALTTEVDLRGGVRYDDRVLWDRNKITEHNKWLDYNDYMADDRVLFDALTHLNQYGLLFLRNVPDSETSVVDLASRIGALKDTFYGRTWDVRSKAKAENIAYTPQFLGLHMDLLYTSNPPHLQLLHSLRARTPGGASFFSDAFHAARQLQRLSPAHFRTLTSFPVTYHYHHPTHHYHYTRPVIDLHPSQHYSDPSHVALRRVNWSPPFQGPFEVRTGSGGAESLRAFIAASNAYEKLLSSEGNLFEYRLNEGECVIFDNRRVLHARRAFDATKGERWLKGAYVDDDVFFSRLRVLQERFDGCWEAEGVVRSKVN
jgi:alpha-ketoglutarate-dependent taurine dioxygenase